MNEAKSISEFLEHISSINSNKYHSVSVSSFTFFRGQSDLEWKISPSLYRMGLFDKEKLMLTELQHICPHEFIGNRFDILTKMQHYGMPTRLLDATTNPLVALYFACKDNLEKDGVVYVFPNLPVSWSDDPLIGWIMDYIFDFGPSLNMNQMLAYTEEKYKHITGRGIPQTDKDMLHYLRIGALAVMPAKTNPRILAQDGAFFIFGMKVTQNGNTPKGMHYKCESIEINTPEQIWPSVKIIKIPSEYKKIILEQLDMLGVNENRMFPDLPHQINYIVNRVKENTVK